MKYGRFAAVAVAVLALALVLGQFGGAQAAPAISGMSDKAQAASQRFSIGTQPDTSGGPGLVVTGTTGIIALGTAGPGGVFTSYTDSGIIARTNAPESPAVIGNGNSFGGVFTATRSSSYLVSAGVTGFGPVGVIGYDTSDYTIESIAVFGFNRFNHINADNVGVAGRSIAQNGYGVVGTALGGYTSTIGGTFWNYDYNATAPLALTLRGSGYASGGFSGGNYSTMVRYHGSTPLQLGDVVSLDGNNETFVGQSVLGVTKAAPDNAEAVIGIAQHRYFVIPATAKADNTRLGGDIDHVQVDDTATSFQPGDLIEVVIAGQAQARVSGNLHVGQRLTVGSDGSMVAASSGAEAIGKLASKPDKDGMATVFVTVK